MNVLLKDCVAEVFTDKNLNTLWLNRESKQEIFVLENDLNIGLRLNEKRIRNIELMFLSKVLLSWEIDEFISIGLSIESRVMLNYLDKLKMSKKKIINDIHL